MTLPLPHGDVQPSEVRENFEAIAQQFPVQAPVVTAMPATAADGTEVHYVADSTNGVVWRFRYRTASASAYKWEFIGGGALYSRVDTTQSTASTAFTDLATVGPSITAPLAGDYSISWGARSYNTGAGTIVATGVRFGATEAVAPFYYEHTPAGLNLTLDQAKTIVRTGIAAADVIKLRYAVASGSGTWLNRYLEVKPVRVS